MAITTVLAESKRSMREMEIAVLGLGYVGLPLAVALARRYQVIGFDINSGRVAALRSGVDSTNEISAEDLNNNSLKLTDDAAELTNCSIFIVTVPTPIDEANRPDFGPVLMACEILGPVLSSGAIVVFESTVYPGATEEICGPALETASGLRCGVDFKLGYSPERINPGDKQHPLEEIVKVVAGQDTETLDRLCDIYGSIIPAGVHRASSIKVAEAAKVIENTQRDVNIALMNEISKICHLVGIRSTDVLAAAGTKWNFLKFQPGLVGGHCIGVDPYYLTAKAEQLGYRPEVILSGRRINDGMAAYLAQQVVKLLARSGLPIRSSRAGILGLTFKENVPDIRNSRVVDIYRELHEYGLVPLAHDPLADPEAVRQTYNIDLVPLEELRDVAILVLAVPHEEYRLLTGSTLSEMIAPGGIFVDVKSMIDPASLRNDINYWSL